ncbi:MAG: dicarboxylate/amino acid:cation symporter [Bacteriovoracaceae bacterium]|nr:dicarboxylate/amino acid:cation symporter [Bacteriovoracaceae bacterium]
MSTNSKSKLSLTTMILISLIAGLLVGMIINLTMGHVSEGVGLFLNKYIINGLFHVIGKIFISSIKMLVVPLVFVSLVVGVAGIGDLKKLGRVGSKTLFFYLLTTALAIGLALLIANLIDPGQGLNINIQTASFEAKNAPNFADVLINIIPKNAFDAMVKGNMLQIIFFALLMGVSIASIGNKGASILNFFQESNEIVMKMVTLIMLMAPAGVFCLIAKVFATQGVSVLLPLIKYMVTVLTVLIVHLLLVYTGALGLVARLNVIIFFKKFYSTLLVAFSTSSSNATIPVTMRTVSEKLGVSKSIASFSIPFGATINMDGTAIMQGVAVVFISQVYNIDLTVGDFLMVILTATLASIGTAGVPGVGLITLSMVLTQVGLPVEGIALIIGVDRLLDMSRTAVNISGDAIVSLIVAKSEGEFDRKVYYDPDAGTHDSDELIHDITEAMNESHDVYVADEMRRAVERRQGMERRQQMRRTDDQAPNN